MNHQEANAQLILEQLQEARQALERLRDNMIFECERFQWRLAVTHLLDDPCSGEHDFDNQCPPHSCFLPHLCPPSHLCLPPHLYLTPHQAIIFQSQQLRCASSELVARAETACLTTVSLQPPGEEGEETRRASIQD